MARYHFGTLEWAGDHWERNERSYATTWPDDFSIDVINTHIQPKFHINETVVFQYNFGRGMRWYYGYIKRIVLGWYYKETIEEFYDAQSLFYVIHNASGHDCYVQLKDIRKR